MYFSTSNEPKDLSETSGGMWERRGEGLSVRARRDKLASLLCLVVTPNWQHHLPWAFTEQSGTCSVVLGRGSISIFGILLGKKESVRKTFFGVISVFIEKDVFCKIPGLSVLLL